MYFVYACWCRIKLPVCLWLIILTEYQKIEGREGRDRQECTKHCANFCFIAINITIQRNRSTLRKLGPIIWTAWQTSTGCIRANRLCWLGILALLSVRNDCSTSTVSTFRCSSFTSSFLNEFLLRASRLNSELKKISVFDVMNLLSVWLIAKKILKKIDESLYQIAVSLWHFIGHLREHCYFEYEDL